VEMLVTGASRAELESNTYCTMHAKRKEKELLSLFAAYAAKAWDATECH